MLYEEHAIAAARGWARRFRPAAAKLVSVYESVLRRPPALLKPKRIWYEKPIYYMGSHVNFFTEGDELPWPSYTDALDYELELGAVVCRPLEDATPEEALGAIGGFVVVNDLSARDVQVPEMTSGFGPVKAKNFANAMSAELVTADEVLPRIEALDATVRINGRPCGQGTTAGMQHSLGEMVAYASLGERVVPGELLATGTIPGCSGMETGHWLAPGDEIELEIAGVGTLRNVIGSAR
jgi:2-keto-4-pentenoate hydratase/2-oxohepta-3-ene-1,7-dioic acid hydratase in catechol pathway